MLEHKSQNTKDCFTIKFAYLLRLQFPTIRLVQNDEDLTDV